jgi:hypothetical protein
MSSHGRQGSQAPSARPPTASGTSISSTQAKDNESLQKDILHAFVSKIVAARSVAELVACIPTPAQDPTKKILDQVLTAFLKREVSSSQLMEWRDSLAKDKFDKIAELNSIKAPTIQTSKLAQDTGSLMEIDFSDTLKEAKKIALRQMILIRESEVGALASFCNPTDVAAEIGKVWQKLLVESHVSPEHAAVLGSLQARESLAKSTTSLGANLSFRSIESRRSKAEKRTNAKVAATGALSGNRSEMATFVKEIVKRQQQSARDKKSGKGQRGAGPSKTKNQKSNQSKVGKKRRPTKNAKRGTSGGKQQRKR